MSYFNQFTRQIARLSIIPKSKSKTKSTGMEFIQGVSIAIGGLGFAGLVVKAQNMYQMRPSSSTKVSSYAAVRAYGRPTPAPTVPSQINVRLEGKK